MASKSGPYHGHITAIDKLLKSIEAIDEFSMQFGLPDSDLEAVTQEPDPNFDDYQRAMLFSDGTDDAIKGISVEFAENQHHALEIFQNAAISLPDSIERKETLNAIASLDWDKVTKEEVRLLKRVKLMLETSPLKRVQAKVTPKKAHRQSTAKKSKRSPKTSVTQIEPTSPSKAPTPEPKKPSDQCTLLDFFKSKLPDSKSRASKLKAAKERSWRRAKRLPSPISTGKAARRGGRAEPAIFRRADLERIWEEDHRQAQAGTGSDHSTTGTP